ncbi:TetR/AcrR family transcriptional regulator [Amycolatopsis sp. K13G38]|uniref:TetR/AcrR family transcriptional regulator n=1 Tax=Amycolatopsis acididurans TaxID=2724524 RepID=A0ABX1JBA7_9PSEU|nr:TetR/AcrR family transcriptional regulator [Amycolatopsis acididurans]NKQ57073.1 TetR/AcrR family transcriptional regulator [Amycolatopsis acididurans]
MSTVPTHDDSSLPAVPPEVVAAARRCFARYGVDRVTMEDIAREAGIGRTGLYRLGLAREQISQAAILDKARELVQTLRPDLERDLPFADALVEGSMTVLERGLGDEELNHLVDTCKSVDMHTLMGGPNPTMRALADQLLGPLLHRAADRGELRAGVDLSLALDWIRGVYVMLWLRSDLTARDRRAFIEDFLVPSLAAQR